MTLDMKNNVFWSNFDMDSSGESADAYIPGLSKKGNRRPRIRCKKTLEIKPKIPVKQPQVETYTPRMKQMSSCSSDDTLESRMNKENKRQTNRVSLKDLCAEDKKRVANLIKELARVGDEKEKYLGQLKEERENFEVQVLNLVQQQEQALKEREEVQERLFQCHELLSKYQEQILEKEEKLNESLREQELSPGLTQHPFRLIKNGQSSPFSQRSLSPASYQGRSPRTQPMERRFSREEVKARVERPVTSMIDKEIAMHKSYEVPSTIIGEPTNHRREPLKSTLPRNFRDPIMSSTHKSMEIHPYITESQDLIPLIPDTSPRSSRSQTPRSSRLDAQQKNKVGFKDKLESDENLQYSPNLHQSHIGDREYMKYYKKLKPGQRKRELLSQREKLMEEQNRLQDVLREQERQLQDRQKQLIEKRKMQHERINSLEEKIALGQQEDGSVFNGRVDKLDFDKPLSEVDEDDIPNEAADMVEQGRISRHSIATSPLPHTLPRTPPTAEKGTSISRMECSVQANIPITPPRVDIGTSISRMEYPNLADDILHTPSRYDVGTSISRVLQPSNYDDQLTPTKRDVNKFIDKMTEVTSNLAAMSPGSPGVSRQGNLPLPANRGRSNLSPAVKFPGDKTLSVVDIVNSLDEDLSSPLLSGSYHSPNLKSVSKVTSLEGRLKTSPRIPSSLTRKSVRDQNLYDDESTIEEQEESHILEDIFFLK
ncbi:uncharacterized protein LOC143052956 [Mytilus galloprovincialis]|uniref:uncharacterized protein LOC143052956 n=1 Tax=Mytilus galloprovincialis TaxID=29158 RepID=UPI003F7B75C7